MIKRKTISKKMREAVYDKYNGHCAYCGKKIEYKEMQVDHLIPVQRERWKKYSEEEIEEMFGPSIELTFYPKNTDTEPVEIQEQNLMSPLEDVPF